VAERVAKRLWEEFDDFRGVVGVGEHPTLALDRVERVGREAGLPCSRLDDVVAIGELLFPVGGDLEPGDKTLDGAVGDVLYAYSRRMEVGTRVDLFGHQTPELIHAVLAALAEAPPWMRGPVWD
jgi:hypothetical protein